MRYVAFECLNYQNQTMIVVKIKLIKILETICDNSVEERLVIFFKMCYYVNAAIFKSRSRNVV